MKVIPDCDCYSCDGFRPAHKPFEFTGTDEELGKYPYLKPADGARPNVLREGENANAFPGELTSIEREIKIASVLDSLDHDDDSLWTTKGTPSVKAVEAILGFDTTAVEIKGLRPALVR